MGRPTQGDRPRAPSGIDPRVKSIPPPTHPRGGWPFSEGPPDRRRGGWGRELAGDGSVSAACCCFLPWLGRPGPSMGVRPTRSYMRSLLSDRSFFCFPSSLCMRRPGAATPAAGTDARRPGAACRTCMGAVRAVCACVPYVHACARMLNATRRRWLAAAGGRGCAGWAESARCRPPRRGPCCCATCRCCVRGAVRWLVCHACVSDVHVCHACICARILPACLSGVCHCRPTVAPACMHASAPYRCCMYACHGTLPPAYHAEAPNRPPVTNPRP